MAILKWIEMAEKLAGKRKQKKCFYLQNLYISLIYYRSHRCFRLQNGVRHASKCDENFDSNINEDDTHTKRRFVEEYA